MPIRTNALSTKFPTEQPPIRTNVQLTIEQIMSIRTNVHSNTMTGPTSADNEATLGTIILHNFLISGWMKQFFFWLGDTKIGARVLQIFFGVVCAQ
jgi:hypothetical protein